MTASPPSPPNPYIGPRAFEPGETLYGRERELRDLLGLLVAERIVLLYSPSGAGKTSLIQAALVPALRARDFVVLPTMRVSIEPPPDLAGPDTAPTVLRQIPGLHLAAADTVAPPPEAVGPNRFVLSLLLSLEAALPEDQQLPLDQLAALSLEAYLDRRGGEADEVLIFDQFEEILTVDPAAQAARAAFFAQVGAALRARSRWALFAAREDYVASLAPYLRPIPTRLATTFRLDLLSAAGARDAIVEPARAAGLQFAPAAADRLVDDLRRTFVQRADGSAEELLGPAVEPVQLQVVCRRLWERLPPGARLIDMAEVARAGDVNTALAAYYAERVADAAGATGVAERTIREWFDSQLITPQGIRGQVLQGPQQSQGLPNQAIQPLLDAYLVRAEQRRGATWYELAHDRLIAPIREDNAAWEAANLSALQRQAELWEQEGRPSGLLLRDEALADAELWAEAHAGELTEAEREFLDAARELQAAAERECRQSRRIRLLAIGATALSILALLALAGALLGFREAQVQQRAAERNARVATSRELAAAALNSLQLDPVRGVLLATAAISTTAVAGEPDVPVALDALQQAVQASRARQILAGHTGGVQGIAYSPDGARIATASEDGSLRIWDAASGAALLSIPGAAAPMLDVTWTPDGAQLVAADLQGGVYVVDAASGDLRQSLASGTAAANAVDVSPDGTRIAASFDGATVVWDAASGAELLRLSFDGIVDDVAFSPDGARIATASGVSIDVWDARTGALVVSLVGHTDLVIAVAWSPDGHLLASASLDGTARRWDADTGAQEAVLSGHASSVNAVLWSADGRYLATGSADGTVKVWYIYRDTPLLTLAGHQDWVTRLAWSPDATRLASASLDGTARVWDIGLLPVDGVISVDWSPDGGQLAIGGHFEANAWDIGGRPVAYLASSGAEVTSIRYSPDGSRIAITSPPSGPLGDSLVHADVAAIRDLATGETLALVGHTASVNRAAWSPDGARLATASDDETVRVWDTSSGAELLTLTGHTDWVVGLAWSPDGRRIASGDRSGLTIVWDAASGAELLRQVRDNVEVNSLAWSPDSARLALATFDGQAHILDAASGAELLALDQPPDVRDVAWSPDGARIATLGSDKTLRLWDAADGAELRSYTLPAEPYELAWSHDGARIAVASAATAPLVFELDRSALLDLARQRAIRGPTPQECQAYRLRFAACPPAGATP